MRDWRDETCECGGRVRLGLVEGLCANDFD